MRLRHALPAGLLDAGFASLAELAMLPTTRHERLALVRQSWRIGIPMAAATAVVASGAAALGPGRRSRSL